MSPTVPDLERLRELAGFPPQRKPGTPTSATFRVLPWPTGGRHALLYVPPKVKP